MPIHAGIKGLISAHNKTPVEHLYLETAALPIPYILTSRRIIYLKNILDREDEEKTRKIYKCQVNNPGLNTRIAISEN